MTTNKLIIGITGVGKTTIMKKKIINRYEHTTDNICILDIYGGYTELVNSLNGVNVDVSSKDFTINPLDLLFRDYPNEFDNKRFMNLFIDLYALTCKEVNDLKRAKISKTVTDFYNTKNKNIDEFIERCSYQGLDDFASILSDLKKKNIIGNTTTYYTDRLVNINLEKFSRNQLTPIEVIVSYYILSQMIMNYKTFIKEKRCSKLYIDDIYRCKEIIADIYKICRPYAFSVTGTLEKISDVKEIVNCVHEIFFMKQNDEDIAYIRKYLGLPNDLLKSIKELNIGEGITVRF